MTFTLRAYKNLRTPGMSNPHPLTSSLLAAEYALFAAKVFILQPVERLVFLL